MAGKAVESVLPDDPVVERGGGIVCCVQGCKNNIFKEKHISFHKFPSDKDLRTEWIRIINLHRIGDKPWTPKQFDKICGVHFNQTGKKQCDDKIPKYFPLIVPPGSIEGHLTPSFPKKTFNSKTEHFEEAGRDERHSPSSCSGSEDSFRKLAPSAKRRKLNRPPMQNGKSDSYCWICHKEGTVLCCEVCPRAYHLKCVSEKHLFDGWVCPECKNIMSAENTDTRSLAMSMLTLDQFCTLLKYTVQGLKYNAPEAFLKPVCAEEYPSYSEYVFHPMDLSLIEKNIKQKAYGCTESFLADIRWILHNSIIFNGYQHQLTHSAKSLVKTCESEMNELEICPDCYLHAYTYKDHWFAEPCRTPHIIVWAKLKGFPFWPAKVVRIVDDNVDARFFGAHDRAWVPTNQCYLLSKDMPTPHKSKKKGSFENALEELDVHVRRLREKFGNFEYAPFRTPFDPNHDFVHNKVAKDVIPCIGCKESQDVNLSTEDPSPKSGSSTINLSCNLLTKSVPHQNSERFNSTHPDNAHFTSIQNSPSTDVSGAEKIIKNVNVEKKAPPTGVFEVSERISIDIPKQLELKNTSLNLKILPSRKKTLEATLERIKERIEVKSDEESDGSSLKIIKCEQSNQVDNADVSCEKSPVQDSFYKLISLQLGKKRENNSLEVKVEDHSVDDNLDPKSSLNISLLKQNDHFAQKLDETIESCKAKLGITDIQEQNENLNGTDDEDIEDNGSISSDQELNKPEDSSDYMSEKSEIIDSECYHERNDSYELVMCENSKNVIKQVDENIQGASDEGGKIETSSLVSYVEDNCHNDSVCILNNTSLNGETSLLVSKDSESLIDYKLTVMENSTLENSIPCAKEISKGEDFVSYNDNENFSNESSSYSRSSPDHILRETVKDGRHENNLKIADVLCTLQPELDPSSDASVIHDDKEAGLPLSVSVSSCGVIQKSDNLITSHGSSELQEVINQMQQDMEDMKRTISTLQMKLERHLWQHQQEIVELKHNKNLVMLEMKASLDAENKRTLQELFHQFDLNKIKAIEEIKRKQWCSNCSKEAMFHCCWNTSYCSHSCQRTHWPRHMHFCGQIKQSSANAISSEGMSEDENDSNRLDTPTKEKGGPYENENNAYSSSTTLFSDKLTVPEFTEQVTATTASPPVLLTSAGMYKTSQPHILETASHCLSSLNTTNSNSQALLKSTQPQIILATTLSQTLSTPSQLVIANLKNSSSQVIFCTTQTHQMVTESQTIAGISKSPVLSTSQADNFLKSSVSKSVLSSHNPNIVKVSHPQSLLSDSQLPNHQQSSITQVLLTSTIPEVHNIDSQFQASVSHMPDVHLLSSGVKMNKQDLSEVAMKQLPKIKHQEELLDNSIEISRGAFQSVAKKDLDVVKEVEDCINDTSVYDTELSTDVEDYHSLPDDLSAPEDESQDDDGDEMAELANGIEVNAKSLNKCLVFGTNASRLTRHLMTLLFPDATQLANCCALGQKSNVTKKARPALPYKEVKAVIDYVQRRFPSAPRSEIVLAMNLKCKEARRSLNRIESSNRIWKSMVSSLPSQQLAKKKSVPDSAVQEVSTTDKSKSLE